MKTSNGFAITTHSFIQKAKLDIHGNCTTKLFNNLRLVRDVTFQEFLTVFSNLYNKKHLSSSYQRFTQSSDICVYEFGYDNTLDTGEVISFFEDLNGRYTLNVIQDKMYIAQWSEIHPDDIKLFKNILGCGNA